MHLHKQSEEQMLSVNRNGSLFTLSPVAVPKILCLLFASQNFDRCHSLSSLYLPQAAVASLPPCVFFSPFFCDKTKEWAVGDKPTIIDIYG